MDQFWGLCFSTFTNLYLNDILYFVNKSDITDYADDITPYSVDAKMEPLLNSLVIDTNTLIKWFNDNYLKLNADKCHLLISNHNKDIHINIEEEVIECSNSVKLLRVTLDNNLNFKDIHINIEEEVIECCNSVKLLRVTLDNNLNFKDHLSNLCKKSQSKITCVSKNHKLHV